MDFNDSTVNRLAYTQLAIKAIAAYLLSSMQTPSAIALFLFVDILYVQFERNARGVTLFKWPTVTIAYYIALMVIHIGW